MDIKIFVATHKKYWMSDDDVYIPLHVGREEKDDLGYKCCDNTGDNISLKNSNYCELTGLYWMWKNVQCDYVGLCHYRRYFTFFNKKKISVNNGKDIVASREHYEKYLVDKDVILPQKLQMWRHTVYEQYADAHYAKDMDITISVLKEKYPEYSVACDRVIKRHSLYPYNMFVMSKKNFDRYCKWLFNILFEVEKRVDISEYDTYQKRIFGFLSERLFNIWLYKQNLKTLEGEVVFFGEKERAMSCGRRFIKRLLCWFFSIYDDIVLR